MAEPDFCHLYLLADANEPAIKIGVAHDVFARAASLPQRIDFAASYIANGDRDACYRAEKVLHKLLDKHRLPALPGDGGTEWFNNACKDRALALLSTLSEDLGTSTPQPCPPAPLATKSLAQRKPRTIRVWDEARIARVESAIAELIDLLAIIAPANPYIAESWEDSYQVEFDSDLAQLPNNLHGRAYLVESLNGGMAGLNGYGGNKRDIVSYLRLISPGKLFRWMREDESLSVEYTERIERAATRYAAAHAAIPKEPRASGHFSNFR